MSRENFRNHVVSEEVLKQWAASAVVEVEGEMRTLGQSLTPEFYRVMDLSVGRALLRFGVNSPPPGEEPYSDGQFLLEFARSVSKRWLKLLTLFVEFEANVKKLPMVDKQAGVLKRDGFTSKEILDMRDGARLFFDTVSESTSSAQKEEAAATKRRWAA